MKKESAQNFPGDLPAARAADSERALWQEVALLRTIINGTPELVCVRDTQGRIVMANPSYEKLLGQTQAELLGKTVGDLFAPDEAEVMQESDRRVLHSGQAETVDEVVTLPVGRRVLRTAKSAYRNEQQQIAGVLALATDITEAKAVEAANARLLIDEQKARRAAEAASRTKDEFLAVVSHELRAPLSALLGWAKILKSGKYTPDTFDRAIDIIERSARTQQKIVEDLLDSARIIRGDLRLEVRPVNLTQVVSAALETLKLAMEAKGITLALVIAPEVDVINGDPDRLQQVVWNLVSNAVKFSTHGGHLSVRLERVDPYIQLTVSDTGKGISAETLPFIFERFRQADSSTTRRHGGLGLGLSLVKNLIELHGGTVAAESPGEDQGATFIVRLPVRAMRVATTATIEGVKSARRKTVRQLDGLRVLVIDDEQDAREMVATMLEQNGARVTIADSVEAAFTNFRQASPSADGQAGPPFDIVVSDLGMPKQDGYAFVRGLRALPPERGGQIPAIALTAYGRAEDRIRVLAAGFQTHVLKPVEPAELVIVIANLTGRGKTAGAGKRVPDSSVGTVPQP